MQLDKMEKLARERHIPVILEEGLCCLVGEVVKKSPQRILEIGTAIGYSGIMILDNCCETTILDTIEIDEERAAEAIENFANAGYSVGEKVFVHVGDGVTIIPELMKANIYDFVFIDAAKSKYLQYFKLVQNELLSGAVVFADNVYFRGLVRGCEMPKRKYRTIVLNLRKFIEYITTLDNFETVIYDQGDGIAISVKN